MRFNEPASSGSIPLEGAWETSGIRFCSSNQDAGIPCVFQVLRPISAHTYPCQGGTLSKTTLTVDEGGNATYTVKLDTQPSQSLTVTITDPTDNTDVTASPATLTFTTVNWSTAQTVTVTAAQDDEADDETATVTHAVASTDATCNAVTAGDVAVSVDADETAAITLSKSTLEIEEGETDGTTYTVKLAVKPTAGVTVTISGQAGTDLTLNSSTLTFTTSDWDTAQTVTVTAAETRTRTDDTEKLTHTGHRRRGIRRDQGGPAGDRWRRRDHGDLRGPHVPDG